MPSASDPPRSEPQFLLRHIAKPPDRQITPPPPPTSREAAVTTVRTLRDAGHVAYFAGGCVRDALLGRTPGDYDVATDARPEVVRKLFRRSKPVGAAFGVVQVYHGHGAHRRTTEVATFRREWGYTDGRRPDHVAFSDAEADAQRRDFTINGLFQDPLHEEGDADHVIDLVGGRADLDARVLRCIGDPAARFGEDHLRMLRAVRFAARLGFDIAPDTAGAVRQHATHLHDIAPERVGDELRRMVADAATLHRAATLLHDLGLLAELTATFTDRPADTLPDLLAHPPEGESDPWVGFLLAWVAATSDTGQPLNPRALRRLPTALRLSNPEAALLRDAAACFDTLPDWPGLNTAQRKRLAARPGFPTALHVYADSPTPTPSTSDRSKAQGGRAGSATLARTIAADVAALATDGIGLAPPPLLTGDTLIAAGFPAGRDMGRILQAVYDRQLNGTVADAKAALAAAQRLRADS